MNQLKINAQVLAQALGRAPYVAKHDTLKTVLLIVKSNEVTLTSSDSSATMVQRILYEGGELDPVCLDILILNGVLQNLVGTITLKQDGEKITLTSGKRRFNIPSIPADHFPTLPDTDIELFNINMQGFLEGLRRVFYASPKDDVRQYLNGVCLQPQYVVATDGKRMAVYPFECDLPDENGVIIPNNSVQLIHKHVHDDCTAHLVRLKNSTYIHTLCFKSESYDLYCRLIDGRYPQWQQLAIDANKHPVKISLNKKETMGALQRLALYETLINIKQIKNGISLTAKDAQDTINTKCECDDDFNVTLSNRLLSDVISMCNDNDEITLHGGLMMDDQKSVRAWQIKIKNKDEAHYIMPYGR